MQVFHAVYDWFMGFMGLKELISILNSGNYDTLRTIKGVFAVIYPIFPLLFLIEVIATVIYKKFRIVDYKISFFSFALNSLIFRFASLSLVIFSIGWASQYALFKTTFTWYWFIYGYIVWELGHWIYHFLAHKVRLFWCIHSTHHASETMNLSVSYAHFFLEAPFADIIRTCTCILLGVHPTLFFLIMAIDSAYGGFIHIGEHMIKNARFGFLEKYILTPSHHRVHHGKNPLYMDTNFSNLLNIWDRIFGTYQEEKTEVPVEYGITRDMKPGSFTDAYFGEFAALMRDVAKAPGLKNKVLYLFMPPGWSHEGHYKTADKMRSEYLKQQEPATSGSLVNMSE